MALECFIDNAPTGFGIRSGCRADCYVRGMATFLLSQTSCSLRTMIGGENFEAVRKARAGDHSWGELRSRVLL